MLVQTIKCSNEKNKKYLTLSSDYLKMVLWYVDTSFAAHPDNKIHIKAIMTIGQLNMQSVSGKHKLNTSSSSDADLVSLDDSSVNNLCMVLFI